MEVEASALDKEVEEDEYGLYLELPRLLDDHRRVLCEVCGESYTDDSFDMVMCQNAPYTAEDTGLALLEEAEYKCMNGRHFACFPVPIDEAPEGDWYCESCEALREQEAPSRPGATGAQHSTASGSGAGPSRPGRPAKHKHVAGNAKPTKEAARMQLTRQEPATGPLLKTQKPGMQRPASGQPEGPRRAAVAQKDAFSSLLGSMKARAAVEGAGRDESQREQELKARSKRNREQHAQQPHEARAQACLRQRPVWTGQLRAQAPAPHARQDTELADVLLDVVAHALDKPFTTEAAAQLPQALHLSSAVSIAEDLGLRADDESQVYDAAALLFSASHAAANASRSADNIYAVCRMLHEKHQAGRVELGPDAKGMWLALVARPGDGSLNSLWGVLVAPKEQPRRGQAPSVGCLKKGQQQAPDEQAEKQPQAARGRIHWLDNTRVDKRADSCELGPGPIYSAQARGAHDRPQPDLAEQQATGHAAQQACSTLQQEGSTGQQASGRRSMSLAPQLGGTAGHSGGDGDEAMAISTSLGKREREAAADSGDAKRLRLPDAPQPVNPASGAQPKPAPHPRTASAHAQPVGPASIEQPKAGLNPQPVSRQTGSDGEANPMRLRVADAWAGFTADARASKGSIGDGDRDTPALPAAHLGQQQPRPQGGRPNAAVWHKPLRGLSYSIPGWPSDEHAAFQLPEKVHVKADRLRRDLHRLGAVWHRIPYPHVRVLCFLEELSRQGFEEADGLADMWVGFRVHPDHRGQNGEPPAEPQDSRSFRLLDFLEHPVRFYKGLSFLERCGTLQREPHPGPELHGCVELFPAGVFVVTDAQTLAAAAESLAPLLALLRRGHLSCAQGSLWQLRLSKTDLATLEVTAPGVAAQLREALEVQERKKEKQQRLKQQHAPGQAPESKELLAESEPDHVKSRA
ncbi:hypothetical protein WJX72_001954 [[Myrmecia] bisecta]|uniref:PHD-type domain-containing protein n=1 Tax=[Myrmecia] bisecta TaxID=41462 RepID=A0AAW1PGD5_9CHLO